MKFKTQITDVEIVKELSEHVNINSKKFEGLRHYKVNEMEMKVNEKLP